MIRQRGLPIHFVGSNNPVKMKAVKDAIRRNWPRVRFGPDVIQAIEFRSAVPAQPFGDKETREGAIFRAKTAYKLGRKDMGMAALTVPTLGWGLEGGVFDDPETQTMWITVWVCVYDGEQAYTVNGCRFEIPNDIAAHVREGMELGDAVDTVIRQEGTKYSRGIIGVLTNDFLDRADAYGHLALLALGLWVGRKWRAAARRALQ